MFVLTLPDATETRDVKLVRLHSKLVEYLSTHGYEHAPGQSARPLPDLSPKWFSLQAPAGLVQGLHADQGATHPPNHLRNINLPFLFYPLKKSTTH